VGLTDVAEIVGVSRQNMRKLMLAYRGSFPAPVHEGSASIWHLAEVLTWLEDKGSYVLDRSILETARATLEVNSAREARRLPAKAVRDLKLLIA
jgi:predicted DNA-binding transcriptional regulator AlpA